MARLLFVGQLLVVGACLCLGLINADSLPLPSASLIGPASPSFAVGNAESARDRDRVNKEKETQINGKKREGEGEKLENLVLTKASATAAIIATTTSESLIEKESERQTERQPETENEELFVFDILNPNVHQSQQQQQQQQRSASSIRNSLDEINNQYVPIVEINQWGQVHHMIKSKYDLFEMFSFSSWKDLRFLDDDFLNISGSFSVRYHHETKGVAAQSGASILILCCENIKLLIDYTQNKLFVVQYNERSESGMLIKQLAQALAQRSHPQQQLTQAKQSEKLPFRRPTMIFRKLTHAIEKFSGRNAIQSTEFQIDQLNSVVMPILAEHLQSCIFEQTIALRSAVKSTTSQCSSFKNRKGSSIMAVKNYQRTTIKPLTDDIMKMQKKIDASKHFIESVLDVQGSLRRKELLLGKPQDWECSLDMMRCELGWINVEVSDLFGQLTNLQNQLSEQIELQAFFTQRFEMILAISTFAVGLGAMITGLFGMNLLSHFETNEFAFFIVSLFIGTIMSLIFKKLMDVARNQNLF